MNAEATVIRVMADYECFPLWIRGSQTVENLDPVDLPITRGLTDQLLQWADTYDRTLNRDDPAASGFPREEDEERFYRGGEELARELARQLTGSHQVEYFDGRTGRTTLVTVQGAS